MKTPKFIGQNQLWYDAEDEMFGSFFEPSEMLIGRLKSAIDDLIV